MSSEKTKERLIDWLASKNIEDNTTALLSDPNWIESKEIKWLDLKQNPKSYFANKPIQIVGSRMELYLEYKKKEVARFGRWKNNQPNQACSAAPEQSA